MNLPGQELKKTRESTGISLEEISHSTRISLKFLAALEEDRLDVFAGEFFLRAIVRSYAKFLGLDEEEVLSRYQDAFAVKEQKRPEPCETPEPEARPARTRIVWLYSAGAVLIAGIALATFLAVKKDKPAARPLETASIPSVPAVRQEQTAALPKPEPDILPQKPAEDPAMEISLLFNEETWIQLFADGEVKLNGLLFPGQRFTTRAIKEIRINLGNAGGLTYTINGRPGESFGKRGEVRHNILITPDNLQEFQPTAGNGGAGTDAQAGRS